MKLLLLEAERTWTGFMLFFLFNGEIKHLVDFFSTCKLKEAHASFCIEHTQKRNLGLLSCIYTAFESLTENKLFHQ